MEEIFKDLCNFKGSDIVGERYQISNYGRIYDKINNIFPKLSLCGNPQYYYITLTHNGYRKTHRVHRLVALAFIPKTNIIVDHINRDRLDNKVSNLRWVSRITNYKNSNYVDNIGDNAHKVRSDVKYKGVSIDNKVNFKSKYYGQFSSSKVAAQVFDVIASQYLTNPILNFPNEPLLCKYNEICNYKVSKPQNKKRLDRATEDRIKYIWKHEHTSYKKIITKYKISMTYLKSIIGNIPKKETKPKFKSIDCHRIWLCGVIQDAYINKGIHSRKQLSKIYNVPIKTVDNILKPLPNLGRRKITDNLRDDVVYYYTNINSCISRCVEYFGYDKDTIRRILIKRGVI